MDSNNNVSIMIPSTYSLGNWQFYSWVTRSSSPTWLSVQVSICFDLVAFYPLFIYVWLKKHPSITRSVETTLVCFNKVKNKKSWSLLLLLLIQKHLLTQCSFHFLKHHLRNYFKNYISMQGCCCWTPESWSDPPAQTPLEALTQNKLLDCNGIEKLIRKQTSGLRRSKMECLEKPGFFTIEALTTSSGFCPNATMWSWAK